jgi:hypothetical protein
MLYTTMFEVVGVCRKPISASRPAGQPKKGPH